MHDMAVASAKIGTIPLGSRACDDLENATSSASSQLRHAM